MQLESSFRNTTDMRQEGYAWMADLLDAVGLPLEIVFISRDQVLSIHAFDYAEGQEKPLVQWSIWWLDILRAPRMRPASVMSAIMAVHPDGSCHTIAQ